MELRYSLMLMALGFYDLSIAGPSRLSDLNNMRLLLLRLDTSLFSLNSVLFLR